MISSFFTSDYYVDNQQNRPQLNQAAAGCSQLDEKQSQVQALEQKLAFLTREVATLKVSISAKEEELKGKIKELDRKILKVDGRGQIMNLNTQAIHSQVTVLAQSVWNLQSRMEQVEEVRNPIHHGKK